MQGKRCGTITEKQMTRLRKDPPRVGDAFALSFITEGYWNSGGAELKTVVSGEIGGRAADTESVDLYWRNLQCFQAFEQPVTSEKRVLGTCSDGPG